MVSPTIFDHYIQFNIDQSGCAMKINTDGVLLGALTKANQPKSILDIGTGTGVIALMLAQRFPDAHIDGVEVDSSAAATARNNFTNSPFADRLGLYANSFELFFKANTDKKYDLIVSNPPFHINSLQSPGAARKLAKHADVTFFEDLIQVVLDQLSTDGLFWLILPITTGVLVKELAGKVNLHLRQMINIRSYPDSAPHREILAFGHYQTKPTNAEFVIYNQPKQYTGQYHTVLKNFLTIFPY